VITSDPAEWLLEQGIDSISLNPDTAVDSWIRLGSDSQSSF
jgi:pyruvate,water dikinase